MGMFDKVKEKVTGAAKDNPDKVSEGLDKGGDVADEKTGGKHTDKIDQGVDKAGEALGAESDSDQQGGQDKGGGNS